jgi:hypothetical protein
MHSRRLMGWLVPALAVLIVARAGPAAAADDPVLLRLFLTDGSSLASYGEPARIGDRVIFSMPTAATPNPPLQLVNLPASRVNWERTDKYAESVRAARYTESQGELDYAVLAERMTLALNSLNETADPARRLVIAENARKMLAAWPREHYNYRLTEVRQMLSLLDEAIADLRAASGEGRFDLTLTAVAAAPIASAEPLMAPPTAKEAIEQALVAARVADSANERAALLDTALAGLTRDAAALPSDWLETTRQSVAAEIESERRVDRSYQALARRIVARADLQARAANVTGLARLADTVRINDKTLGGQRPEVVETLIAVVQARLDAARRLRLARDRWALRQPAFTTYRAAIKTPLDLFVRIEPDLEQIKSLAGNTPASLMMLRSVALQILSQAGAIVPPEEFRQAHALLVSAVQMAGNAARIRQEATLAGDIARAWDASSAAAGALMLVARARDDMQNTLRPPQLR